MTTEEYGEKMDLLLKLNLAGELSDHGYEVLRAELQKDYYKEDNKKGSMNHENCIH